MNKIKLILVVMIAVVINACQNSSQPESDGYKTVYSTSFEKESDISDWSGVSKYNLTTSTCPEGEHFSLNISGGCMQPAASCEIPVVPSGKYKLSFWAKMGQASQSAGLCLKQADSLDFIDTVNVQVTDTTWKYYETEKSLNMNSPSKLKIEVFVGGIIYANVFIDNLKVIKTK